MIVRVHRQPVKEVKGTGRFTRVAVPCETKELHAEVVFGLGIQVVFPFNHHALFNKYNGVGRGRLQDWLIDPADLLKLLAEAAPKKDKPSVVQAPANG